MPVTAIYVHQPETTLTIDSGGTPLISETGEVIPIDKPVTLAAGVYLVASKKDVVVTGHGRGERYDIHNPRKQTRAGGASLSAASAASKDDWPDPPKNFLARKDAIVNWLIAKGGEPW